jgi:hypothetical protein
VGKEDHDRTFLIVLGGSACVYGFDYIYSRMIKEPTDMRGVAVPKVPAFVIVPAGFFLTVQFFRMARSKLTSKRGLREQMSGPAPEGPNDGASS